MAVNPTVIVIQTEHLSGKNGFIIHRLGQYNETNNNITRFFKN